MSTSYRVIELVRKAISTEYVTASDTQVARAMGISRASISAYKLGREVMSHEMLSRANVLMKLSNYQLGELGWQLLNERARSDQERSVYAAMRAAGRAIARSVLLAAAIGLGAGALPSQHVRSAELGGTSPAVHIMSNRWCGHGGNLPCRPRSLYPHADASELRPTRQLPVHPDSHGMPDEVISRHEPDVLKAAVLAVVAIVTHEEVLPCGHDTIEIRHHAPGRQKQHVLRIPERFLGERRAVE